MQLSDRQELLRSSRKLNRKMTPRHGKTLRLPLFVGSYLTNPSSPSCKSRTLRKKVAPAFRWHQNRRNLTLGATSTTRAKTDGRNKTMLEVSQFSPRGCRAYAKILSDSLKCDPWTHELEKEGMFRHGVELSARQDFLRSSQNLDRKIALRWAKNTPVASAHRTISLQPKLGFPQV